MHNNYEALVAKCRAMMGDLLKPENYSGFEGKKTVAEAAMYLKTFPAYSKILDGEDLNKINRGKLENLLEDNLFDAYHKIYKFSFGTQRKFFAFLITEIEVQYILKFIRVSLSGSPPHLHYQFNQSYVPKLLSQSSKVDFDALAAAVSVREIIAALSGSEFAPIISGYLRELDVSSANIIPQIDFAELETLLYNYYYKRMLEECVPSLGKQDGELFKTIIATRADLSNISKIVRLIRISEGTGTPAPEYAGIKKYLIDVRNKLKSSDIEQILRRKNSSEIINYCARLYPSLDKYIRSGTSHGDYFSIFMNVFARKIVRRPVSSPLILYGYLTLRQYEMNNVIFIIESIRYSLPKSVIERGITVF